MEMINAYRVRGHLMADTDPLEYRQRRHHDLDVQTHGLTLWDLDREFATGSFAGGQGLMKMRKILGILRDSYCRTIGIEYMHISEPAQRKWIQDRVERPHESLPREEHLRILDKLNEAEIFETFLQTKFVGQKRFSPGGRRVGDRAAGRGLRAGGRRRAGRGLHRHAAPRPAERAVQHRGQVVRADLPRVRGQHRPADGAGLRGREVPPGLRGPVHRAQRGDDQDLGRRQPQPPGGGQPGAGGHRPGQAGHPRPGRRVPGAAGADARRRRVRRPGRGRGDAEPVPAARLPHRRHHPHHREQPGRLHHLADRVPVLDLLHRRGPDDRRRRSSTSTATTRRPASGWPGWPSRSGRSSTRTSSST